MESLNVLHKPAGGPAFEAADFQPVDWLAGERCQPVRPIVEMVAGPVRAENRSVHLLVPWGLAVTLHPRANARGSPTRRD